MADTQVRQIQVTATVNGNADLKEIANNLGQINQKATSLLSGLRGLQTAFASYYAVLKVGQLTSVADEITNLQSRLVSITGSTTEAAKAFAAIEQIASDTRSSVTGAGDTYARLGAVLKDTGISTNVLTTLTTTLLNTFRLSGKSSEEASTGVIQLAKGLAIGTLRGRDLKTIIQENSELAGILSKSLHVTSAELYTMAQNGDLTAKSALKALFDASTDVNERAGEMSVTFGQTFTRAMNLAQVGIANLNKSLGVSDGFASVINYLIDKLPLIGVALLLLASTQIPVLIAAFISLTVASVAFVASNPILAFLSVLSVAIVAGTKDIATFKNGLLDFATSFLTIRQAAISALDPVGKFIDYITFSKAGTHALKYDADDTAASIAKLQGLKSPDVVADPAKIGASTDELSKYIASLKTAPPEALKLKDILALLNQELISGQITLDQYTDKLNDFDLLKLRTQFSEGKIELEKFRTEYVQIQGIINQRDFNKGAIDLETYNDNVKKLKIEDLNTKFQNGKITLNEYNKELLTTNTSFKDGITSSNTYKVGVQNYLDSIGTLATGIASVVTSAFSHLEDALVDFVKKGKFNFADLTTAILDDLLKIIIRASIISPLANGILSGLNSSGSISTGKATQLPATGGLSDVGVASANGNVFDGGLRKFATGGIVSSPTLFKYGGNSTGLMGEAGAEAIVPLSRGSGGKLGVNASLSPVTVNIVNQANVDVTSNETTDASGGRVIETIIKNKVAESISNGSYDKLFKTSYGLQRKGS